MANAAVKIKIMPSSTNVNLKEMEGKAKKLIEDFKGANIKFEIEPIAFGLNAIIISFAWDEGSDRESLEAKLSKIPNVSSAEIIDFRRAFG